MARRKRKKRTAPMTDDQRRKLIELGWAPERINGWPKWKADREIRKHTSSVPAPRIRTLVCSRCDYEKPTCEYFKADRSPPVCRRCRECKFPMPSNHPAIVSKQLT